MLNTIKRFLAAIFGTGTHISGSDLNSKLEKRAALKSERLNYRESIVDLLKLLDMDSSMAGRKKLAAKLGIDDYSGTAQQNIAMHRKVRARVAENGGNVPGDLL